MIIFTHIPRTGGRALIEYSYKEYRRKRTVTRFHRKEYSDPPPSYPDKYKFAVGHVAYGCHKYFPDTKDIKYITFLRNPISRWKSFFNKTIFTTNTSYRRELWIKKARGNIISFLSYVLKNDMHCNVMVKMLSGLEDLSNIIRVPGIKYTYIYTSRKKKYSEDEMEKFYEAAKYNLLNNYYFVGFQENYVNDFKKLSDKLGWKKKSLKRSNVSKNKPRVGWKDKKVRKLLRQMNKYDIRFYNEMSNILKINL
ncbi:MAG: sulfotransferase family 2 domain-containing protein [Candidatus Asgardarchaeum sp.]